MTGVELYARLIATGHSIPTILITAYPDPAVRSQALQDGVLCYPEKPFSDQDLMRSVDLALRGLGPSATP